MGEPNWWVARPGTRDDSRLFREKHGELTVYSDYREMLAHEGLDVVSIATAAT